MSTALNNAGHNCNLITQAESMVMAKERLVEQYGELRYTIGTGCSGGSLTQQQVANAYPGLYQGILPRARSPTPGRPATQLVGYVLSACYLENPAKWAPGVMWDPLSIAAVDGHPNPVNPIVFDIGLLDRSPRDRRRLRGRAGRACTTPSRTPAV